MKPITLAAVALAMWLGCAWFSSASRLDAVRFEGSESLLTRVRGGDCFVLQDQPCSELGFGEGNGLGSLCPVAGCSYIESEDAYLCSTSETWEDITNQTFDACQGNAPPQNGYTFCGEVANEPEMSCCVIRQCNATICSLNDYGYYVCQTTQSDSFVENGCGYTPNGLSEVRCPNG